MADVAEGLPQKLVTNVSDIYRPHWSRNGKWIYFSSFEVGRTGVYRCPASGGDATVISKGIEGINPQESFDGGTVYYFERGLKKVPLVMGQPGTESEVEGIPRFKLSESWALSRSGIYFVPAEAPRSVRYFDFSTRQVRPIFEVDEVLGSGMSVSPDGRWILYSQVGDVNSDIMLVDHFH